MKQLFAWIKSHPYSLWLLYYIPYLICFMLLERFITPVIIIHSPLDEMIPFNEYFILPYLLWFPYMFGSFLHVSWHEHLIINLSHRSEWIESSC